MVGKYSSDVSAFAAVYFVLLISLFMISDGVRAEYGDIVMNNYSEKAGMRPAVFPHWFHRIRFRCKICHTDLGFQFKAGGSGINMLKLINGEYCGACHNGRVAWNMENCSLCHSAKPGTPTQVHQSTTSLLSDTVPVDQPLTTDSKK